MNFDIVRNQLGLLMLVLSAMLLAMAGFSAAELQWASDAADEREALYALLASAAAGASLGWGLTRPRTSALRPHIGHRKGKVLVALTWLFLRPRKATLSKHIGRREAMLLVALSWFVGAAVAGAPYWAWALCSGLEDHALRGPMNCYFEAMSGLTTTGATILPEIETVPRSLLLWRALTHWLGGLGIVVLFVAVLPSLGVGGKKLFRVEAPGPQQEGVRPHIGETARVLWYLYAGLTAAAVLAYRATGSMGWFDAVCHAFSVISTGGLSTRDASIGYYDSFGVDLVTIVFMLIAGVNFALFYQMVRGRFKSAWSDVELRVYLALKLFVVIVIVLNLLGTPIVTTKGTVLDPATTGEVVRHATFTTVALQTGTGFGTADYDTWPYLSRALLLVLFFVGGCAGSTAGGVKVIRFWIAAKVLAAELERAFRPQVVRPVRVGRSTIDTGMQQAAVVYIVFFLLIFAVGSIALQLTEPADGKCDGTTAISAALSCLCNVGPGLHGVGATQNYEWMTSGSKLVLSLLMVLGRLEIFALAVLLTPRFWRRT